MIIFDGVYFSSRMRGTRHSRFMGSRHLLRRNVLSFLTRTSFFLKITPQPASQSGGAAMRLFFFPGRMFPILASSGSESILILIVFDVFIDCPFGMVTVFVVIVEYFSVGARLYNKCSDAAVSKNTVLSKVLLSQADFSKFDLNC